MRIILAVSIALTLLTGLAWAAPPIGIEIERLKDLTANVCPICKKVIAPGDIRQDAETTMESNIQEILLDRDIKYTMGKAERYLGIFIYRFTERQGSGWSVDRPASAGFHVHLFDGDALVKVSVFDETQQPLLSNIFRIGTFLKRGMKWVTVSELSKEGLESAISELREELTK